MPALVLNIQEHEIDNRLLYTVQVTRQVHRYDSFPEFIASNGFTLLSTGYPMLYCMNRGKEPITIKGKRIAGASTSSIDKMCVMGRGTFMDDHVIYIDSPLYIEKLKQAVKEYNASMG